MSVPRLEPELADHLRVEFGQRGARAVEFLESAQLAYAGAATDWPRGGETVAFLCREALVSITSAAGTEDGGRWHELSREVVRAADRYDNATQTHDEGVAGLLAELFRRINEVKRFHDEGESRHQQQLIAVIVARAGLPPSAASGVIAAFQDLLDRLNDALHGDCSVAKAGEMFGQCIALVGKLFLPPQARSEELKRLAAIGSPSPADVEELLELVGTPVHLSQFVRLVNSPPWLLRLDEAGVFDKEHADVWWGLASAAERLGPQHAEAMSRLLGGLWSRNRQDAERVQCVASAASRIGRPGAELLLEMLRRHQDHHWVAADAMQAALGLDASASLVTDLVDLLFNETCWSHLFTPKELAEHFVSGIDEDNAHARLRVLCFKLGTEDPDRRLLGRLLWDQRGTLAELGEPRREERAPVLVSCLVSALRRVWALLPIREILAALDGLPGGVRERSRAWVLSEAPEVESELLTDEVERAVGTRAPNGDDAALVDRAVQADPAGGTAERWKQALGDPPSVEEIGQAMASDPPPRELLRRADWVQLLPAEALAAWHTATPLIEARYSLFSREQLVHRPRVETEMAGFVSPLSDEELNAMPPEQVAELIAAGRSEPSDDYRDPRELALALQRVMAQAPDRWLSDPVGLVQKLHHPAYISAYLQGVKEAVAKADLPVDALLDVIALVYATPWDAAPFTGRPRGHQADWKEAQRAGLDLIEAMAVADVQFKARSDQAWALLHSTATDTSAESWTTMDDPLTRAINRDCTRAFEAAVIFVAAEMRVGKPARAEFIELLRFALTRRGSDGAEFRAIVARRLRWLRHAMPDWTDRNIELLFGADVPDGLAQLTVDLAIHWEPPHLWLFETVPEMVRDAVLRDVEGAMTHLMTAMLRDWPGYGLDDIVRFAIQHLHDYPDLASRMGEHISYLISGEDVPPQLVDIAARLWEELLDTSADSVIKGFGNMARATGLDDERWAELTLRTLENDANRGRWLYDGIERALQLPSARAKLAVLNAIVRGPLERWHLHKISEKVGSVLGCASELADTMEYRQLTIALHEHDLLRDGTQEKS